MLRFAIVDDHPVVLRGLKEIIEEHFDGAAIDLNSCGYELLNKIAAHEYDFILLDISLSDINGLEVLRLLKKMKPKLKILVLSMYPEEQYAVRALKAGANGYLSKGSASDELVLAVRKILCGKRYITPAFAEELILRFESSAEAPPHDSLSDRELQVLQMLGQGRTVQEIATELHLSANTVRTYRARILDKIGVKGTSELIHYALTHNLTE